MSRNYKKTKLKMKKNSKLIVNYRFKDSKTVLVFSLALVVTDPYRFQIWPKFVKIRFFVHKLSIFSKKKKTIRKMNC